MIEILINEFNRNPNMWIFIISILLLLSYAAIKIKNEPNDYLKKSTLFEFQHFILQIPSWWSLTVNENHLIKFERTDTNYDWYAQYWTVKDDSRSIDIILNELVSSLNIIFDDSDNLEKFHLKKESGNFPIEISRVEGMSTMDAIDRAYFDIFVAKSDNKILIGKSHSSILNGCVEGPYFEEVLQRLKVKISD